MEFFTNRNQYLLDWVLTKASGFLVQIAGSILERFQIQILF